MDDNLDTAEMYAAGLTCAGYRPLIATDVKTAVVHVHADRPSVVVTDLSLLGVGGGT